MVCHAKEVAAAARERALETQIKRFEKGYRRRLRKLAKASSRIGDVLYAFPAAAFALVSGRTDHVRRGEAVRLIKDGAGLRQVGELLELPAWTRRLPPEAFTEALGELPSGEAFGRRIVNAVPQDEAAVAMWLRWLQAGYETCDADFALWLARQPIYRAGREELGVPVLPLAAYAWYSRLDEAERARKLVPRPWHKQMGFGAAIENACTWYERVVLDLTRGDRQRGPGRYRNRKRRQGYNLVALRTAQELHDEGEAMNHCVGSYVREVVCGNCAIYSVRHGGQRIATLELRWVYGHSRPPVVNQLLGHSNTPVSPEVKAAVGIWLKENAAGSFANPRAIGALPVDETRWRAFWSSYIARKGDGGPVTGQPSQELLRRMSRELATLTHCVRGY